jgi:hypothetical protein
MFWNTLFPAVPPVLTTLVHNGVHSVTEYLQKKGWLSTLGFISIADTGTHEKINKVSKRKAPNLIDKNKTQRVIIPLRLFVCSEVEHLYDAVPELENELHYCHRDNHRDYRDDQVQKCGHEIDNTIDDGADCSVEIESHFLFLLAGSQQYLPL